MEADDGDIGALDSVGDQEAFDRLGMRARHQLLGLLEHAGPRVAVG